MYTQTCIASSREEKGTHVTQDGEGRRMQDEENIFRWKKVYCFTFFKESEFYVEFILTGYSQSIILPSSMFYGLLQKMICVIYCNICVCVCVCVCVCPYWYSGICDYTTLSISCQIPYFVLVTCLPQ